jgi:hypothetical protein
MATPAPAPCSFPSRSWSTTLASATVVAG